MTLVVQIEVVWVFKVIEVVVAAWVFEAIKAVKTVLAI
jgi:hypothetical protein